MTRSFEMPPQLTAGNNNARKAGRVRCVCAECDLGEILDLSSAGMRVNCRRKPPVEVGTRVSAVVDGHDGPFDITGRIAWKKRVGFFRWQVGVSFDELSPAARKGLATLARSSLQNDSIAVQERARKSA